MSPTCHPMARCLGVQLATGISKLLLKPHSLAISHIPHSTQAQQCNLSRSQSVGVMMRIAPLRRSFQVLPALRLRPGCAISETQRQVHAMKPGRRAFVSLERRPYIRYGYQYPIRPRFQVLQRVTIHQQVWVATAEMLGVGAPESGCGPIVTPDFHAVGNNNQLQGSGGA
jgi:hypothetical protein